jgi:XTP/dITP diphosphohydrolase
MILLLATRNADKVKEIKDIFSGIPELELRCALDYPELPEVVEDGETLEENSAKKALEIARKTGLPTLADDTGLFVDVLGGVPGVYSARYAGPDCSYADNRKKMLVEMQGHDERKARFITVATLATPEGVVASAQGVVTGVITRKERGTGGFGYDAIFEVSGRTFGEMTDAQKNSLSHRARAIRKLMPEIRRFFQCEENSDLPMK